ncbi:MAG TPA: hypothetical protein VLT57_02800 [Bryobacteraceae bacterium]|nr:hypothetical protein [Bryobacteraceae bacterium]
MIYAIQFFVGSKYGTWAIGTERFPTMHHAQREIDHRYWREKSADIAPMFRRPIAIANDQRIAA